MTHRPPVIPPHHPNPSPLLPPPPPSLEMVNNPIRIAILECDTPAPKTNAKYNGYGGLFRHLLETAADELGRPDISATRGLEISSWNIVDAQTYPALEDIDAVLLTGSKHNSFDNSDWILALLDYVQKILAQDRVRMIGVCFGHQIIGRALGSKVGRNDAGWETSVCNVDLSAKGKEIFRKNNLSIHQMHHDVVISCPEGVETLGSSSRCSVQGMYAQGRLITVQGHPEFDADIVTELLESRHAQGVFDDATFADSMRRVNYEQDGVPIARAFLRFLLDGR